MSGGLLWLGGGSEWIVHMVLFLRVGGSSGRHLPSLIGRCSILLVVVDELG